jgi:hypothetical protein
MTAPRVPDGFNDPRAMDTRALERAVSSASRDLAEGVLPERVNADTAAWLEGALRELERRRSADSKSATITGSDGETFTAALERHAGRITLNLTSQTLDVRLPLTGFIARLIARKLERRVIA